MAWRNCSHNPACCLQPCAHLLVPKILSKTGHDGQCLPFCPFLFFLPHNSFLLCINYLSLHSLFTLSIPPPRRVQQSFFQCCQLCSAQLLEGSVFSKFPSPELRLLLVTPLCRALGLQCLMWCFPVCWDAPTLLKALRAETCCTLLSEAPNICFVMNSSFLPQQFGKDISLQAGCLQ